MHEKLIKQIKELPGVMSLTVLDNKDWGTIFFESVKQAVECENVEQWDFIAKKTRLSTRFTDGLSLSAIDPEYSDTSWYKSQSDWCVLPFSQYLTDYNLTDEWERFLIGEAEKRYPKGTKVISAIDDVFKFTCSGRFKYLSAIGTIADSKTMYAIRTDFGKWAEIIPDEVELVEGEMYVFDEDRIGRFESENTNNTFALHSQLLSSGKLYANKGAENLHSDRPIAATPNQIAKLIKAEIKNGYLWKDGKLIKFK